MKPHHEHPIANWLLSMPRSLKRVLAVLLDIFFCAFAVWLGLYLRLERWVGEDLVYLPAVTGSILLAIPLFARFGVYRAIFRHSGWNAMLGLMKGVVAYSVCYFLIFTVVGINGVPRTLGIIQPLLLFVLVGISRVMVRVVLGDLYKELIGQHKQPGVLVYGAGSAGRQIALALRKGHEQRLLGFLDDDTRMQGNTVDGVPVYAPANLAGLIEKLDVRHVLLAMPSLERQQRNAILHDLRRQPVHVRTLPDMAALVTDQVGLADLQELDLADILGRDPALPDEALLSRDIRGKVVMLTGAGGSIGSELCRQVLRCAPVRILLVERSEFSLYQIDHELRNMLQLAQDVERAAGAVPLPPPELIPLLASAGDEARMEQIIGTWRPHTIYHAAAYKHVPLVEHNPVEGIRNNVWSTLVCAEAALRHGVKSFVLVSTDKAVRPTNLMGASKRLAEMVLQALAVRVVESHADTCFSMVRFGNVLGSSGSVVPLFRRQIEQGGPITLTHVDVTRYFMTIPEASELVIQAGAMAKGGEVFVLDMGESVRIFDLACRMVELSGLQVRDAQHPNGQIEIKVTGMRPGEKLYEELLIGNDPQETELDHVMKANERFLPWTALVAELATLDAALRAFDIPAIRALMQRVADYEPAGDAVDWVYLAQAQMQTPSANASRLPELEPAIEAEAA